MTKAKQLYVRVERFVEGFDKRGAKTPSAALFDWSSSTDQSVHVKKKSFGEKTKNEKHEKTDQQLPPTGLNKLDLDRSLWKIPNSRKFVVSGLWNHPPPLSDKSEEVMDLDSPHIYSEYMIHTSLVGRNQRKGRWHFEYTSGYVDNSSIDRYSCMCHMISIVWYHMTIRGTISSCV